MWEKLSDKLAEWADDFPLRNELALFSVGLAAGAVLAGFACLIWR